MINPTGLGIPNALPTEAAKVAVHSHGNFLVFWSILGLAATIALGIFIYRLIKWAIVDCPFCNHNIRFHSKNQMISESIGCHKVGAMPHRHKEKNTWQYVISHCKCKLSQGEIILHWQIIEEKLERIKLLR